MKSSTKNLLRQALVAAVYFIMTFTIKEFAFGQVQFRYSEILTLLAFYNPIYIPALTVGCFLVNTFSPFGIADMIVGTFHTFISCYMMSKIKNIYIASTMPALFSFIIGLEIAFLSGTFENFFITTCKIMLSEFIAVSILGIIVFKVLEKNKTFYSNILIQK